VSFSHRSHLIHSSSFSHICIWQNLYIFFLSNNEQKQSDLSRKWTKLWNGQSDFTLITKCSAANTQATRSNVNRPKAHEHDDWTGWSAASAGLVGGLGSFAQCNNSKSQVLWVTSHKLLHHFGRVLPPNTLPGYCQGWKITKLHHSLAKTVSY